MENDIVIISLTSVRPSHFANDLNRTLVAFSRARHELHVVGNIKAFNNDIFDKLRDTAVYCEI